MNSASSGCAKSTSALEKVRSVMAIPAYRPSTVPRAPGRRALSSLAGAPIRSHRHPVARSQGDDRLQLDPAPRVVLEAPGSPDRRQQDARLELGEPLTDAHPGTATEGQERMAVSPLLLQPPLRPEGRGVGPPARVVMQEPRRHDHDGARRDPDAVGRGVPIRLSVLSPRPAGRAES